MIAEMIKMVTDRDELIEKLLDFLNDIDDDVIFKPCNTSKLADIYASIEKLEAKLQVPS